MSRALLIAGVVLHVGGVLTVVAGCAIAARRLHRRECAAGWPLDRAMPLGVLASLAGLLLRLGAG